MTLTPISWNQSRPCQSWLFLNLQCCLHLNLPHFKLLLLKSFKAMTNHSSCQQLPLVRVIEIGIWFKSLLTTPYLSIHPAFTMTNSWSIYISSIHLTFAIMPSTNDIGWNIIQRPCSQSQIAWSIYLIRPSALSEDFAKSQHLTPLWMWTYPIHLDKSIHGPFNIATVNIPGWLENSFQPIYFISQSSPIKSSANIINPCELIHSWDS